MEERRCEIASIADVYVTILPETGKIADGIKKALLAADKDVRAAASRWKREIEAELKDIGVEVKLKVDSRKAKEEIDKAAKDQTATINADADTGKAEAKLDATARDRRAQIKVDVDDASVTRAGRKISQNLRKASGTGKGTFSKGGGGVNLPFRATIPLPVAIEAIGLAPNIVPAIGSMVQSVGQLSGAFALLPSVIGATGLAFGSLKIGMSGFSNALKDIGDPKKFSEAIKQLSPAAQEAATAIQGLMPQITQLKMTVQDALFTGMGEQFTKLGSTYLPIFQDVMSRMASSAGTAFQGISKQLQTPAMQSDIKTFGTNASQAFSNLLQAAQPLVKAFVDLATVGSGFLPQLSTTVADLAKRFGDFIGEARESGKLAEWIQNGITAFTQLKDIAVNVWNIFKGLFEAAGGGDFLKTIVDLTNQWTIWVNSVGGQNSLKQFFDDAKQSLNEWWPIIRDLGVTLFNAFYGAKAVIDQIVPLLQQISHLLADHSGLVYAVGVAFGAWKLASIVADIGKIGGALLGLEATAATAGAGVTAQLAAITAPGWLLALLGAGGVAAVGYGANRAVDAGYDLSTSRFGPRPGHTGEGTGLPGTKGVTGSPPRPKTDTTLFGSSAQQPGTPPPGASSPHPGTTQDVPYVGGPSPNAIPNVSQQPASPGQFYTPPIPTSGGGGGGGSGKADAVSPVPGAPYTYQGFGELNWEALAQAESGGNWSINTGNGFFGGVQFDQATWEQYGGKQFADRADLADKSDQIKVATALYNARGTQPWPANGWLLTATPDQLKQSGLTGSGRQSTSSGRGSGRGGSGGGGGYYGSGGGRGGGGGGGGGYPGDKALLGSIPRPGTYSQTGSADLAQGLGDCSSAVEDLVNMLDRAPTAGRGMSTANAPQWLTSHGFMLNTTGANIPGAFNVGFNAEHMQATLPDSTNFNWGSQGQAARGGVGGTGAFDPAFTQHYYRPVAADYSYDGPGMNPNSPMYTQPAKDSGGEQLGKDIVSGILDVFGFGDIFKSPLDFGAFKLFKGLAKFGGGLMGGDGGGDGGTAGFMSDFVPGQGGGGGDSGLINFASSFIPGQGQQQGGMNNSGNFNVQINAASANARDFGPVIDEYLAPHARQGLRNNPMP